MRLSGSFPLRATAAFATLMFALAGACSEPTPPIVSPPPPSVPPPPPPVPPPPPPPPAPPIQVIAAGDIADCNRPHDERTAAIVDQYPEATILALGDNAYPSGTAQQFTDCYAPSWGRFKSRTRPAVGNHEYVTPGASGYFGYFGAAAGDPSKGYYSFDIGKYWHFVVLNSNGTEGGPSLDETSAQIAWLRADLAASNRMCTVAYFHHPRFSSSDRYRSPRVDYAFRVLYEAGVDLVLVGHDHVYERFAPANAAGNADPAYGVRQFTSGMAGSDSASAYAFAPATPLTEARQNLVTGVLKLELDSAGYAWQFLPIAGRSYSDSGRDECHGAPPPAGSASSARTALAILDPARHDRPRSAATRLPEDAFRASAIAAARHRASR